MNFLGVLHFLLFWPFYTFSFYICHHGGSYCSILSPVELVPNVEVVGGGRNTFVFMEENILRTTRHATQRVLGSIMFPPIPTRWKPSFQGRFSDACTAAEEARDLDPFGKEVRLLCPRLMALHSEDAGSQVPVRYHGKYFLHRRGVADEHEACRF